MHFYVYYLKQTYPPAFIEAMLSALLHTNSSLIAELAQPGEFPLRYEHRYLDATEFCAELSIFCWDNDFEARTGGKIAFGSKLSHHLGQEVVVKYRDEDPHEWVLIDKDRLFITREMVGDNIGINLLRDQLHELRP